MHVKKFSNCGAQGFYRPFAVRRLPLIGLNRDLPAFDRPANATRGRLQPGIGEDRGAG